MVCESREVFEKIKNLYGFKNLTELSNYFEKNGNWAAQMAKKGSVPYPQCVQTCNEKGVSLDWVLMGNDKQSINRSVLLNEIQEGLYESKELGILEEMSLDQLKATSALILKKLENEIQVFSSDTNLKNKKAI